MPNKQIANGNREFERLMNELTGKSLEEYRKQVANQKKRIAEELELIPARIDEVKRNLPEALNWQEITEQVQELESQLAHTEESIVNKSKAYEAAYEEKEALQHKLHEARNKLSSLVARSEMDKDKQSHQAQVQRDNFLREKQRFEQHITDLEGAIASWEKKAAEVDSEMKALKENTGAFIASIIDLYNGDKYLQDCEPKQVVMEALKAATLKLPINKSLGFAFTGEESS